MSAWDWLGFALILSIPLWMVVAWWLTRRYEKRSQ